MRQCWCFQHPRRTCPVHNRCSRCCRHCPCISQPHTRCSPSNPRHCTGPLHKQGTPHFLYLPGAVQEDNPRTELSCPSRHHACQQYNACTAHWRVDTTLLRRCCSLQRIAKYQGQMPFGRGRGYRLKRHCHRRRTDRRRSRHTRHSRHFVHPRSNICQRHTLYSWSVPGCCSPCLRRTEYRPCSGWSRSARQGTESSPPGRRSSVRHRMASTSRTSLRCSSVQLDKSRMHPRRCLPDTAQQDNQCRQRRHMCTPAPVRRRGRS